MVARSNLLLDFNAKAGPPIPSVSGNRRTNITGGPPLWGRALVFELEGKPAASDPSSPETTHGRSVPGIGRFAEEPVIC
jgi:hypothetical protein